MSASPEMLSSAPADLEARREEALRTLELPRAASRTSIEKAYWSLIESAQRSELPGAAYARRVSELNAAYELLSTALLVSRPVEPAARGRHMSLPSLWPKFRTANQINPSPNPIAEAKGPEVAPPPDMPDDARCDGDHVAALEDVVVEEGGASSSDVEPCVPLDASPQPDASAVAFALKPDETSPLSEPGAESTSGDAISSPSAVSRPGLLTRLFRSRDLPEVAADDRILSLRKIGEPTCPDDESTGSFSDQTASAPGAARLVFLSGPQVGRVITLSDQPADGLELQLPASDDDAPARVRLWRERDRVFLQHLDGAPIAVSDTPLAMPLIVLDHGDEISTGTTRVRFEQR